MQCDSLLTARMKKGIYLLVLIMIMGCNEKTIQKPENLISKDQMSEILYDLAVINAAKKTNPWRLSDRDIETMPFIYQKHGIDSVQFVQSDIYYASIPSEYETIYKVVEARLEREKAVYEKEKTRVSDSIRKITEKQRQLLKEQKAKNKMKDTLQ